MGEASRLLNAVKAIIGFLAIGGGAFGGFHVLDNQSEDLPKSIVSRTVGAAVKTATGRTPSPAGPASVVTKVLETAAAVATGAPAPVEEGVPDYVAPGGKDDHGAHARATSNYGSASCDCSCAENESFGEKAMRWLPFLGFLPGIGP